MSGHRAGIYCGRIRLGLVEMGIAGEQKTLAGFKLREAVFSVGESKYNNN